MATTFKNLFRGAAAVSSQTLYTVPSLTTTIVHNIIIANTSTSSRTYTIWLNDIKMAEAVSIPANDSLSIDLKQVLSSGQTIKAQASAIDVNFHIAGLEIT